MTKKTNRNRAVRRTSAETLRPTKTLAHLAFEEFVTSTLRAWKADLPPGFTPDDFADLVHKYLNCCKQKVRTGTGLMLEAGMLVENLRPPLMGDNWEVLHQTDFKEWAEPLLGNSDFLMVADRIKPVRARATELHISWQEAEPILQQMIDKLLRRDKRPLKIQRGELLVRIIAELEQIKHQRGEFRDFGQLIDKYPQFEVVRMHQGPSFSDDDRAYLASPGRWQTRPGSYSHGILDQYWGTKSKDTYKSYRHALNSWKR